MQRYIAEGYIKEEMIGDVIVLNISKEEVRNKDFDTVSKFLDLLTKNKRKGAFRNYITFMYDDVPGEICEIDEVSEYVRGIYKKYPHFFYYLAPNSMVAFLQCIVDMKMNSSRTQLVEKEKGKLRSMWEEVHRNMLEYADSIGDLDTAIEIVQMFK